jgi:hypothetical protein
LSERKITIPAQAISVPGHLARAQALGAERGEDAEREQRAAGEHERGGKRRRQVHAVHHHADVQRVPDQPAQHEARQVLAPRPGGADAVAEDDHQQRGREQRQQREAQEHERAHPHVVEHVLGEGEIHAPHEHRGEGGRQRAV